MEFKIWDFIKWVWSVSPRIALGLGIIAVLIVAAKLLLPIILGFRSKEQSDATAAREQERQDEINERKSLLAIIQGDITANRAENARRFELDERQTKALEVSVEQLREQGARLASMDHRVSEAHAAMLSELALIKDRTNRS